MMHIFSTDAHDGIDKYKNSVEEEKHLFGKIVGRKNCHASQKCHLKTPY